MDAESSLQDARENFAIDNFQECLKLLHGIAVIPPELREQVDLLIIRAYVAHPCLRRHQ